MTGGVSHVDSFDPKPKLFADHGKTVTVDNGRASPASSTAISKSRNGTSSRAASSGIEVSDLFPHVARCVDDLCVIRSLSRTTRTTTKRR